MSSAKVPGDRSRDVIMSEWRGLSPFPDAGAKVVDEPVFRFLIDLEVQKAQRLRYCISLVCLDAEVAAAETRGPSAPSLAPIVTRYLRGTDVVTPWPPASLALLLIHAETVDLPSILRRLTALLGAIAWSAGGASYPRTTTRADELLSQAVELMVRAKNEGGNRFYVAS
jgi:hypothetical protein